MKQQTHLFSIVWIILTALLATACQPQIVAVDAVTCFSDFEATVQQGPSAGLTVQGKLYFTLDHSGALSGAVANNDGTAIPVVGQANGRAINLTFQVGEQKFLFGVGAAEQPIYQCSGYWGGGFTGPEPGDSGDWLAADGQNILDPNFEGVQAGVINAAEINPGAGETIDITLPGAPSGTINFSCGETACTCEEGQDCVDLVETKLCKGNLKKNDDGTRSCTYR